jgi:hypothetical protein
MGQLESPNISSSIAIIPFGEDSLVPMEDDQMEPEEEAVMLAVKYNLVTSLTSFIIKPE